MAPLITAHEFDLTPGPLLPQDSGYMVLSALSRQHPFLHGNSKLQIAPVRGTRDRNPAMVRLDRHSVLHIRGLDAEQAAAISGSWFSANGAIVGLGAARERVLGPSPYLASRLVVLAEMVEQDAFIEAARRLADLPEGVRLELGRRRAIRVKGRAYLGHSVHLHGLDDATSLRLQANGIGKYTSMGCGVLYPGSASGSAPR